MGCCSPFSAATTRLAADPSRHVNFTTGMVLGVDDYAQEFAYHSERDKWMIRELAGYGTLSGLAVTVEADGANGPRVRVTAGAAAAPSGQLICVGRDQCGSLNPWLARPEVVEELRNRTEHSATPAAATLNLFLTLCYVDCAVAEVPIPGEPCRSDENLMAPSRIADDYCLDFCFDPPPMTEATAIDTLAAFYATLDIAGANPDTPAAYADALRQAELQLGIALGIRAADAPAPAAADLGPVKLNPGAVVRFGAELRKLWITKIRPPVMAQRCGAGAAAANDCVLLGRLRVPVVNPGTHWEVAGPPAGKALSVELDESDRPLLLAANVTQTPVGFAMEADGRGRKLAFMTGGGTITVGSGLVIVHSENPATVIVPAPISAGLGKVLTIKATGAGAVRVSAPKSAVTIDGAKTFELPARGAVSLVSDGNQTWHVTGQVH